MQKITPFLWFDTEAEEAARFYVSIFANSKVGRISRFPEGSPGGVAGQAMTVEFELDGQKLTGLNGGPHFKFTEAFSLSVDCADQAEVDRLWAALTADGGEESQCGWLKDRYGLSWQIVPRMLTQLLSDPDAAKAQRVTEAMLQMRKLDVATLQAAADRV